MSAPQDTNDSATIMRNPSPPSLVLKQFGAAPAPGLVTRTAQPSHQVVSSFFEVVRLTAAFEAAWEKSAKDMKKAKTLPDRRRIRDEEAMACEIAAQTVVTDEGYELYRSRMLLLSYGRDLAVVEDKFFVPGH